jgi:PAS domain S-box-containing protein
MLDFLSKLFDTSDFPARWNCGNWTAGHGWLHVVSDLGVWSAYVAIPCVLGYFVLRRKDIPFRTIFLLFGMFILACGTTHLMEASLFWWPAYRLAGLIKLGTALVSWGTVLALVPVTPKALAMRSPDELEREIAARKEAEFALQRANAELEQQIEALKASEERFRLLVEGTRDHAIFMLDPGGRVASWNLGAERIKQYQAGEIIGQHISRFYPLEDIQTGKPERELQEAAAEGSHEEEGWRIRKDGSRFWASVVITALRDEQGHLRGYSKITRDLTERKQAEQNTRSLLEEAAARRAAEEHAAAIWEERERLRVTLHSIGDGVIATDARGLVTLLNPVAEALTGWTSAQATGQPLKTIFRIVNETTRQEVENPVARVLQEGQIVGLANHTILIANDGTERPIDDSAAPIKDEQGQTVGVVLVFRDATEQRQAEQTERRAREIFQLVHQIGKIGHWEWNSLTDESRWSPEIEALYGLPPGGFEGGYRGWAKLLHPDDLPRAEEAVRRALQTGEYFTEFRVIWPDGSVHWLETRANVFKDGHDRPVRIMGVNMDITERKRQEERLRLLWEAASVLLTTTEPDVMLRELFARIGPHLGLDGYLNYMVNEAGDALRLVSYIGIPEETAREISQLEFGQAICGRVALQRQALVVTHVQESDDPRAQRIRSFGIRAYACNPLQINNDLLGTLSFASRSRDQFEEDELEFLRTICHYVAVAYERLRLVRQLRDADRRKDEFLATLAHELRNPLAPLRNAVELLHRAGGDAAVSEQVRGLMGRQLDQMVRLVDELLDMSRISQGKVRLRKERVELKAVVRHAVEATWPLLQAQAHEWTVSVPPEPIYLDADSTRLAQVISNLLNNAAKYTEKGGHIWLTAERQGNDAVLSVRDTGIGIAAEHLPHLFEMFSQVAPALERSQGGLGIGLALVRGLVELHGGRVEAHSAGIAKGSEFIVRLPAEDVTVLNLPEQAAEDSKAGSARKRRILAVDDNRDSADSLAMMLRMMGHETRTAYDGLEAVQAAATYRPDVVLLDIGLPKMNGYEVARHIRQQPWGQRMILIAQTGWGQEEDKRRALEAGFDQHLTKPVEAAVLETLLGVLSPGQQH